MTLEAGTRFSSYEVVEPIGSGGMGEVWRAKDTELKRDVALKILPQGFADDTDRLARFQREAELLASLNHPNIATIHGLAHADGQTVIVMELVEGRTLADRIQDGPIPPDEAMGFALQIIAALEAAHERGTIHRDLKPANIKVRPDGTVKVLDFGIAKAIRAGEGTGDRLAAITSPAATDAGMVLGTAAYMSPEQARGRPVDKRTDIWAFGCVLYEMLTGQPAFTGQDTTSTLARVLERNPDMRPLPASLSPAVRGTLELCLQKDPNHRLRDIGDVRLALSGELKILTPDDAAPPRQPAWLPFAAALAAGLLVAGIWLVTGGGDPPESRVVAFEVNVPVMPNPYQVAVSPDGQWIAYFAELDGSSSLFLRSIDDVAVRRLDGTAGANNMFWSPDSRQIAFFSQGRLNRIDVLSGRVEPICDADQNAGGTWNEDGIIVFSSRDELQRVAAQGGRPTPITTLDESLEETAHSFPRFLPDGERYLYLAWSADLANRAIYVGRLDSAERTRILPSESMAVYADPGQLLFLRQGTLYAQPFDPETLELGPDTAIRRLVDRIPMGTFGAFGAFGQAAVDVSANGVLVYRRGEDLTGRSALSQFEWFDRTGNRLGAAGEPASYSTNFDLTADGARIAAIESDQVTGVRDIWVIDTLRGGASQRVTNDQADQNNVAWSPDGLDLVIGATNRSGESIDIFVKRATMGSAERSLVEAPGADFPEDWSADGDYVVYHRGNVAYALPMTDSPEPAEILRRPTGILVDEMQISFSGNWLAYASDESGRFEVYLMPFPEPGDPIQLTTNGGSQPRWKGDDSELYYLDYDGSLMAIDMNVRGDSIDASPPRRMFDTGLDPDMIVDQYAVTADGERFLILLPVPEATPAPVSVVVGWTARLLD